MEVDIMRLPGFTAGNGLSLTQGYYSTSWNAAKTGIAAVKPALAVENVPLMSGRAVCEAAGGTFSRIGFYEVCQLPDGTMIVCSQIRHLCVVAKAEAYRT
jgi:hypothetical protein